MWGQWTLERSVGMSCQSACDLIKYFWENDTSDTACSVLIVAQIAKWSEVRIGVPTEAVTTPNESLKRRSKHLPDPCVGLHMICSQPDSDKKSKALKPWTCLEYCSHIWGSSPYTSLLDRVESKAIRVIGDPSLTSTLDPLSLSQGGFSISFLPLLIWSLLWWIGRLYSTSNGSSTFHTAGIICPQLLCGTFQCKK